MPTFADIIDLWPKPSPVTLAADLGELPATVRQWRNRSVLPDRTWKATVEAAARREIPGVTLDVLATIAAGKGVAAEGASAADKEPGRAGAAA